MYYNVKQINTPFQPDSGFDCFPWNQANEDRIGYFHNQSSDHRPEIRFKMLYDTENIFVRFLVCDRYVRSVNIEYQGPVCKDSCVEFFVQPFKDKGYFNFEINAGGHLLLFYINDHTRLPQGGFAEMIRLPFEDAKQIDIWHSLPSKVDPEITGFCTWGIAYNIPIKLLEKYCGSIGVLKGQCWRGNFFKCGDETSHPHWASWSPISRLNFHQPADFGDIIFV